MSSNAMVVGNYTLDLKLNYSTFSSQGVMLECHGITLHNSLFFTKKTYAKL
jgi:hypothetical protein